MYEELREATRKLKERSGLSNARIAEMISTPGQPVSKQTVGQWLSGQVVLNPKVMDRLGVLLEQSGWKLVEAPKEDN